MNDPIPTPADLMRRTAIGNGLHRWPLEGGAVEIGADELQPLLEEAYDPTMSNWPATIAWDAFIGWWVA